MSTGQVLMAVRADGELEYEEGGNQPWSLCI